MQKMFGLIVIIVLIWYGLSVYTGDGMGGVDLGSWLEPIGTEHDDGDVEVDERMEFGEPELASDVLRDYDPGSSENSQRRQKTGRQSITKAETIPQAMKRRVTDAYQKSYDRVE